MNFLKNTDKEQYTILSQNYTVSLGLTDFLLYLAFRMNDLVSIKKRS